MAVFIAGLGAALALLGAGAAPVLAQAPSTKAAAVVKCEVDGQTLYTDLPCSEARRIAVELSPRDADPVPKSESYPGEGTRVDRGLAVGPRFLLAATDRNLECPHLEQRMALVAAEGMRAVSVDALRMLEERTTVQRHWHRALGC